MKGGHFSPGQAYVACSRVKNLQGLYINNFNLTAIKKSTKVESEVERLAEKLIEPVPKPPCLYSTNNSLDIALLNVRSILSKVEDGRSDEFNSTCRYKYYVFVKHGFIHVILHLM